VKGYHNSFITTLLTFLVFLFCPLFIWGQSNISSTYEMLEEASFFENYEIRQELRDTISAPFLTVLNTPKKIYEQTGNEIPVKFEVRKSAEHFYLLFLNEYNYAYPVWGRGSYIIKRDIRTGDFVQLKIFIQNDEGSYLRLFPVGDRTRMDVYLFGSRIYESILIPVEFKRILISPFSILLNLTSDSVDWQSLFTDVSWSEWDNVEALVDEIKPYLDDISEVDDGAQNRFGDFVFIESEKRQTDTAGLNCSGFTKWIADGIYSAYPSEVELFGPYIDLETLKVEHREEEDHKNVWNENNLDRDPYFGLDWIRNLASVLYKRRTGIESGLKDFDVNETPYFHYVENLGYAIEDLSAILYLQAVKNPGSIYLGAINTEYGTAPVLRQYRHVSAFFPWFSEDGDFHISVMDTGVEKYVVTLEGQFPGAYVHLVMIEGVDNIALPPIND